MLLSQMRPTWFWFRCDLCHVLIQDKNAFMIHKDDKHNNECGHGGEGDGTNVFHTAFSPACSACSLTELPESLKLNVFIPRIQLTKLEGIYEASLVKIYLPYVALPRMEPKIEVGHDDGGKGIEMGIPTKRKPTSANIRGMSGDCIICGRHFKKLKYHLKGCQRRNKLGLPDVTFGKFMCSICNAYLPTTVTLEAHVELFHRSQRKYKCKTCSKPFATLRTLRQHARRRSCVPVKGKRQEPNMNNQPTLSPTGIDQKPVAPIIESRSEGSDEYGGKCAINRSCPFCERRIQNTKLRNIHIEKCKGRTEPYFPCLYSCPANFKTALDLADHVELFHRTKEAYKCEICGKGYATLERLNRHLARSCIPKVKEGKMIIKTEGIIQAGGEGTGVACKLCGKGYSSNLRLNVHMKQYCLPKSKRLQRILPEGFCNKEDLIVEPKTAQKAFYLCPSPSCSARFSNASGIPAHMKLYHTQNPSIKCDYCGIAYPTFESVRNHLTRRPCQQFMKIQEQSRANNDGKVV